MCQALPAGKGGTSRLDRGQRRPEDSVYQNALLERPVMNHRKTEQAYRSLWRWDKTARTTHCVDCYPGNCPYHVFVKDGAIVGSEQSGTLRTVESGVPDLNPMGCQKGAAWHLLLNG